MWDIPLWFPDFRSPVVLSKDPWASTLYSSRYSLEQLETKQRQLIDVISDTFEYNANKYRVERKDGSRFTTTDQVMLEELSIVNEALLFARNDLRNSPDIRITWKWLNAVVDWFSHLVDAAINSPAEELTAWWGLWLGDALHMMPIRDTMRAIADAWFMTKKISEQLVKLSKVLPETKTEIKL